LVQPPSLQSLERETGIEPVTNSLEGCDSTTEFLPLKLAGLRRSLASLGISAAGSRFSHARNPPQLGRLWLYHSSYSRFLPQRLKPHLIGRQSARLRGALLMIRNSGADDEQ